MSAIGRSHIFYSSGDQKELILTVGYLLRGLMLLTEGNNIYIHAFNEYQGFPNSTIFSSKKFVDFFFHYSFWLRIQFKRQSISFCFLYPLKNALINDEFELLDSFIKIRWPKVKIMTMMRVKAQSHQIINFFLWNLSSCFNGNASRFIIEN